MELLDRLDLLLELEFQLSRCLDLRLGHTRDIEDGATRDIERVIGGRRLANVRTRLGDLLSLEGVEGPLLVFRVDQHGVLGLGLVSLVQVHQVRVRGVVGELAGTALSALPQTLGCAHSRFLS